MIRKTWASFIKEFLLLWRDKAGVAILFIMPAALILIMTLLQDSTFKELEEKKIPLLLINHDTATFGENIVTGLDSSRFFDVRFSVKGRQLTDSLLASLIEAGDFQVGIIVPANATKKVRLSLLAKIKNQLPEENLKDFGLDTLDATPQSVKVQIFFDPVLKASLKNTILMALRQYAAGVESELLFDIYSGMLRDVLGITMKKPEASEPVVKFSEQYANTMPGAVIPNSVQHNVPAWTVFAMFFIVIPLAGNMINERNGGIVKRLATIPGALTVSGLGKMSLYFIIGIIQAMLMIAIGVFVLPLFGLPALKVGRQPEALMLLVSFTSLAAGAYGMLLGAFFNSQEQSSVFGSVSVVILAAVGGIWVPVFMMSETMRTISHLSPLNWSLRGFYAIFLRQAGVEEIITELFLLAAFSFIAISLAVFKLKLRK